MDFIDVVRRVQNMKRYGLALDEIHDQLFEEGIPEEIIFFAYQSAEEDS